MDTTLFRAVAFRLERADTPADQSQPEVHAFIEVPAGQLVGLTESDQHSHAAALLIRLLALAWGCAATDVDFYNLWSEQELAAKALCPPTSGEAWLLESGYDHGPLFCNPARTLMLVRPTTLARLQVARAHATVVARQQQLAAGQAHQSTRRAQAAQRQADHQRLTERAEGVGVVAAARQAGLV